jgi:hypothetical protein
VTYFARTGPTTFLPTAHVRGAWREDEQHVAPALGLLTHLVESDHAHRRPAERLAVSRLSFDILGTMPVAEVGTEVVVRRHGRTVELVEAAMSHGGRPAVVLRAWLLRRGDTATEQGSPVEPLPSPDDTPAWQADEVWPGGFITSVDVRRQQHEPGRARFWVRPSVPLLDEPVSSVARWAGVLDIANGMTVREDPRRVAFPNVDLTAHLVRDPVGEWVGFDTSVSFGADGRGLTSSVLHDVEGVVGGLAQSLTVRPLAD